MYTALYRVYRPEVFDEILGQEHIVRILKNQIASDSTSHAYLFCGTRGTGKTTTARLLAKGLNCLSDGERPCGQCSACQAIRDGSFLDVIEIDAASNRGIDDIRSLRESVNYPPSMGRRKVYIIDEVHMLTPESFNALLKTLEEPPEYVTFILATTEVQKLPATILSRCIRLDFKRVPERTIMRGMQKICEDIGIDVTEDALRVIAANADGSVRDGLSILDQCISGGGTRVDASDVLEFLGASGEEVFAELTDLVCRRKTAEAIEFLAGVLADGKDVRQLIRDWINHYRNLLITKFIREPEGVINLSAENIDRIRAQSSVMELADINRGILELSKTMNDARWSTQPRILLELCIVTLCQGAGGLNAAVQMKAPEPERPRAKAAPRQERPARPPEPPKPSEPAKPAEPEKTSQPAKTAAPEKNSESAKTSEPEVTAEPAGTAKAEEPAKPEQAAEPAGYAEPEQPSGASEPAEQDLIRLWDEVFADGESEKGSFYLIRMSSMLISMDDDTFTVEVNGLLNRKHTEKNRRLLEDLMEKRTGRRRSMRVVSAGEGEKKEISAEEAADRASEIIGARVNIE